VLDTLFEAGFNQEDFLMADIRSMTKMLEANLSKGKGTVGWGEPATPHVKAEIITLPAPSCLADADDTAKTISALRLLGWEKELGPMLKAFEADAYFM
jgi:hypothetical protein